MIKIDEPLMSFGIILFILFTFYLIIKFLRIKHHIKKYKSSFYEYFNTKKKIDDIKNYLINWNNLISEQLKILFGEKRNSNEIKNIILSDLRKENYVFHTLVNIAPAFGLLFTFWGLYQTLSSLDFNTFDDIVSSSVFNNIIIALNHLAPVFLFGLWGILIYSLGLWYYSRIEKNQEKISEELNILYHKFEENYYPSKITDLDEFYHKLLKPLNETLSKLRNINKNFEKLGVEVENFIKTIGNNSENLINKIDNFTQTIENNSVNLNNTFSEISIELLGKFENKSQEITGNISDKVKDFSENLKSFNETIISNNKSLREQTEKISPIYEKNIEKLNNINEVLSNYVNNINNLSERLNSLDTVVKNLVELNQNFNNIQEHLKTNVDNLVKNSELIRHSLKSSSDLSKAIDSISEQVNKQLENSNFIIRSLNKFDLEKLIEKIVELEKNNLKELVKELSKAETIKIETIPVNQDNGYENKLSEILIEIKKSNEIFEDLSKNLKNNGKPRRGILDILGIKK